MEPWSPILGIKCNEALASQIRRSFVDRQGRTRFYFQRGPGMKNIPLPGLPWSPTFMAAYEVALSDGHAPQRNLAKVGTVDAAVLDYLKSDGFSRGVASSTGSNRRRILINFAKEHGDKPIALMHPQALQIIVNKMTAAKQRNFKKAMRGFIDYCLSHQLMKVDPLLSVKMTRMKDAGGFRTWDESEIATYEARHVRDQGASGVGVVVANRRGTLRHRANGAAARQEWHVVNATTEDRCPVRYPAIAVLSRRTGIACQGSNDLPDD